MLEPSDIDRYERELRAMVRRAGAEDPEGFATIVQLLDQARGALPLAAELQRRSFAYSWDQLARALGVTRQSAHKRFRGTHNPELVDAGDAELLRGIGASIKAAR